MARETQNELKREREMGMLNMKIENLEKTTGRIENKLDDFIKTADNKYATKEELCELKKYNEKQDNQIEWTKSKILDLIIKVSNIMLILGFGTKALGIW